MYDEQRLVARLGRKKTKTSRIIFLPSWDVAIAYYKIYLALIWTGSSSWQ